MENTKASNQSKTSNQEISREVNRVLGNVSNQELLIRMDRLVQSERKITHVILCHINEVESRRLYGELGFDSMFKYLTHHCGYGEDSAYRRLQAARLLKKNPEIAVKLEQGSLNLTQLTQVQKCLKQESKAGAIYNPEQTLQILEQIENKSSFETKKVLAVEFNQPIQTHEVVKPQRDESVRLELTFTPEQMKTLEQVKSLLSHSLPDGNWAEVIVHLAERHLKKTFGKSDRDHQNDKSSIFHPSKEKEARQTGKNHQSQQESEVHEQPENTTPSFMTKRKRGSIKITLRRKLFQKAKHCCEFVDGKTNTRCGSNYQLQVDHRIPLARGGSDSESNLRVLCRTHNLLMARRWGLIDN